MGHGILKGLAITGNTLLSKRQRLIVLFKVNLYSSCREGLSDEDFQRYTQQFQHIQEITKLYEDEPENYTKLVDLLQQASCMSMSRLVHFAAPLAFLCECLKQVLCLSWRLLPVTQLHPEIACYMSQMICCRRPRQDFVDNAGCQFLGTLCGV